MDRYIIQKMQGPLTTSQKDMFFKNSRFAGYKFPDMTIPADSLEKRYGQKVNKIALDFMKRLLHMNPAERLTGKQCLSHAFFEGIDVEAHLTQKRSELAKRFTRISTPPDKNLVPPLPLLSRESSPVLPKQQAQQQHSQPATAHVIQQQLQTKPSKVQQQQLLLPKQQPSPPQTPASSTTNKKKKDASVMMMIPNSMKKSNATIVMNASNNNKENGVRKKANSLALISPRQPTPDNLFSKPKNSKSPPPPSTTTSIQQQQQQAMTMQIPQRTALSIGEALQRTTTTNKMHLQPPRHANSKPSTAEQSGMGFMDPDEWLQTKSPRTTQYPSFMNKDNNMMSQTPKKKKVQPTVNPQMVWNRSELQTPDSSRTSRKQPQNSKPPPAPKQLPKLGMCCCHIYSL